MPHESGNSPNTAQLDELSMRSLAESSKTPASGIIFDRPTRVLQKIFEHRLPRGATVLGTSALLGLLARDADLTNIGGWSGMILDRVSVLAQIDTGPTTVNHVVPEIASGALFFTSIAYLLGSEGFKRWFDDQLKTSGLKELPKSWHDHSIVIDPERLIFDHVARQTLYKDKELALVHTGDILHGQVLEGGQLKSKKRRHLNSLTPEHLSDYDFLASANPQTSKQWIINLWPPDRALYSKIQDEGNKDTAFTPEKADNIIRTLSNNWQNQKVTVILPKDTKWAFGNAADLFTQQRFPTLNSINVLTPEKIICTRLKESLGDRKLAIVSDMDKVQESFGKDLRDKGIEITSPEEADVIVVYCSNDDIVNAKSRDTKALYGEKPTLALIERATNVDEARSSGAIPLLIPGIVANAM